MAKFQSGNVKESTALVTGIVEIPEVETENEVSTVPVTIDGDALAEHAFRLAAKESVQMRDTFSRLAQAREDWQGGPLYTLLALRGTYETEELDEFAIPGSETGNNPDKFKITVVNGDKRTNRNTTFYAQYARGTQSGKAIIERLDWLDRAADKGASKEGIPEDIMDMSPEQRASHRSWCEGRLNTMTQSYKKAMQLHFKLKEVNDYSANIFAEPIWQEGFSPDDVDNLWDAKVEATQEPIAVWLAEEGKPITKWEPFSIGAFLKLDPAKASEKGGGFKQLVESGIVKKAAGGGATTAAGAAGEDITIKTVDKSLGVIVEYHRYLLDIMSQRDGAEYGKLVQQLTKKGNDEFVTAFVELKNAFIDIAKNNGLDAKYIKLKEAGSELVTETKVPAKAS